MQGSKNRPKTTDKVWKEITGYRWPYRISTDGDVQKFWNGEWVELRPYLSGGRARAMVKMRTADNRKIEVPVVWLMADAFMGGRRNGFCIVHRNGAKLDCALENLKFATRKECGKLSCGNRRRTVLKLDRAGRVIAIYPSVTEAAKRNYISKNAVYNRCANKVKSPFDLDGFNYQYENRK